MPLSTSDSCSANSVTVENTDRKVTASVVVLDVSAWTLVLILATLKDLPCRKFARNMLQTFFQTITYIMYALLRRNKPSS